MYYLKYWRKRGGMTQQELAERVNVHLNTVNRWERGVRKPRSNDITALCKVFGISETELMNGPARTELVVNFFWECDDDMGTMSIKPNEFSWGYRSDGMLIISGALPWDMGVEDILNRIKLELIAAKEGKKARDAALNELGKGEPLNDRQDAITEQDSSVTEGD